MSQTITEAAERPKLFDGFFTENEMLTETGWSYRTLKRREDDGLPVVKLGFTKLYPIEKVRAWFLGQVREQNAARHRGRPRKESKAT
jgi:hypothetical protein